MARVLLISGTTTKEPYPVYPLGMALIADSLIRTGHKVCEYDMLASPRLGVELEAVITKFNPEIIGISIRNIDNLNYTAPESYTNGYKKLVQRLRQLSSAPVVLGGSGYSLYPQVLLEKSGADFGVVGEGEMLFPKLVAKLVANESLTEKLLGSPQQDMLKKFGTSYRNKELAAYYLKHGGMLNLHTKRGCPMKCSYCSYPLLEGQHYRFREPKEVVDEIEKLRNYYEMDYYAIADSVFNDVQGYYLKIAEELVRRKIKIPFTAFLKPGFFKRKDVQLLKNAGLKAVEWGTDGANNTTLKALRKDFTWEEVLHSNDLFDQEGIAGSHFIIFGGPGETTATVEEGLNNIAQLQQAVVMVCLGIRIVPGTKVHRMALEQNLVNKNDDLVAPKYYFSPQVEPTELDQKLRKAFEGRMDRVYPPGRDLDKVEIFHQMGHRGPIWDYLLRSSKDRRGFINK